MAHKIKMTCLEITTETKQQSFDILLRLSGFNLASFSSYMCKPIEEVQEAPQWAENYLKDIIDLDIQHLSYIIKDIKAQGLMMDYENAVLAVKEHILNNTDVGSQPLIIKLSEDANIKASYIVHATEVLMDFITNTQTLDTSLINSEA